MHIAFTFTYTHENGLFTRLLNRIFERSSLSLSLQHEGTSYRIIASGEQPELEALADEISALIPKSLFLSDYAIEAVNKEHSGSVTAFSNDGVSYEIPYCPECQKKVMEHFDAFCTCEVCGFSDISLSMEDLNTYTGVKAKSDHAFFETLANELLEKGELSLPTYNGIRRFSLLSSETPEDAGILICDPVDITDKFLITQGELDALMMVEKPTVRLKPKSKFRVEHELDAPFYPVFFADDKITLALATVLKVKGIKALFCDQVTTLRVASALEQQLIVSTGRDLLPCHIALPLTHSAVCHYNGYEAYGDNNGLVVDDEGDAEKEAQVTYIPNNTKKYQEAVAQKNNDIGFEPAHAALRSVVLEKGLKGKSLCGIHLSHSDTSHIFSFSGKIGYTPMVLFKETNIYQPQEMLEAITSMDDGGARLVENFKKRFPDLYVKVEATMFKPDEEVSAMTRLWAMAAVFIGLYDEMDVKKGCEVLEASAIEFSGKSGPRIDYKVISTDEGYQLDMRLAIRSAMSFKLAGLDDYLLSFGFIDSLADFIAAQAENSDANIGIEGVSLTGSLFENRQLFMRTHNALSKNYPIYWNERLSMDGANIALGALSLGSE